MSASSRFDLENWLLELDTYLSLYLQARYVRHIAKSSKVSKLFFQQAEEKSDFRKKLFAPDVKLADIMAKHELDIRSLLKKTPASLQAFFDTYNIMQLARKAIIPDTQTTSPENLENLVRLMTTTTNDLYYHHNKRSKSSSTLLPFLQNQVAILAEKTNVLTLIETDYVNDAVKGNIHQQIKQNFQANLQPINQQVLAFCLKEKLPLKSPSLNIFTKNLQNDIKLYLQSRYIEANKSFFSSHKKLDDLGLLLFTPGISLTEIIHNEKFNKMMRAAKGAKTAIAEVDGQILETLEHLENIKEGSVASDPLLLKRLHLRLEDICKKLARDGSASRLLPLLQLASSEFATIVNEPSNLTISQKNPLKIREQLLVRADAYSKEHLGEIISQLKAQTIADNTPLYNDITKQQFP